MQPSFQIQTTNSYGGVHPRVSTLIQPSLHITNTRCLVSIPHLDLDVKGVYGHPLRPTVKMTQFTIATD